MALGTVDTSYTAGSVPSPITVYNNAPSSQGSTNNIQQPNSAIGAGVGNPVNGPITYEQQAALFAPVNAGAISTNIGNGYNNYASQSAPQLSTSPLAGLTTLGNVNRAGVLGAGTQTMGLAQAGLNTAGLTNAGNTTINTAQSNALTAAQMQQINALNATAQGQGPNLAAQQAAMTGQQNVANQMALLGSQRGSSNPTLGLRAAQIQAAQANQQAVQAAVQGTTVQELNAQNALTGAMGTAQGQVQQGAQAQASLAQQTALQNAAAGNTQQLQNAAAANQVGLANMGAANQQMQQNAAFGNTANLANASQANQIASQNAAAQNAAMQQQATLNQQANLANQGVQQQTALANLGQLGTTQALNTNEYNAMLQAQMAQASNQSTMDANYANMVTQENTSLAGINNNVAMNSANNQMGMIGAGLQGIGGILGTAVAAGSDINLKTSIRPGARPIKDFLSKISSKQTHSFALME